MVDKILKRKVYDHLGLKCDFTGRTNKRFYEILEYDKVVGYLNVDYARDYTTIGCSVNVFGKDNSEEFNKRFFDFVSQITVDNGLNVRMINSGDPDSLRKFNKSSHVSEKTLNSIEYGLPDNVQGDFSLISYNDRNIFIPEEKVGQLLEHGADITKKSHNKVCHVKSDVSQKDRIQFAEAHSEAILHVRRHNDFENSSMIPHYSDREILILNINDDIKDHITIPEFKDTHKEQDFKKYITIRTNSLTPLDISKINPDNKQFLEYVAINTNHLALPKEKPKYTKYLQNRINFIYDTIKTGHDDIPYRFSGFAQLLEHYPNIEEQIKELRSISKKSEIIKACEEIAEAYKFPLKKDDRELIGF